ncbi:MAG TPA: dephospho-CoA kinase [Saprospiraceae bacterium]|nr:dephospho-CoA kinase [Saprospiraceae bacterium]
MKLIGLTGGIGSGKSTVAGLFRTLGIPVYESDQRAKALMQTNPQVRDEIIALFGPEAYDADQKLNRAWIASRAFTNPELLKHLNEIVHPAVFQDLVDWTGEETQRNASYLIQESALLFEEQLEKRFTAIILVVAPEEIRIERVMKRDGVTRDDVVKRINNQLPDIKKIPGSDYVIYNDGTRSLIDQVMDIHRMIIHLPLNPLLGT